jgi:hypothetical protein
MQEIVDIINTPTCDLSRLRSLTLHIVGDNPSFLKARSLLGLNNSRRESHGRSIDYSPIHNSSLRELRLKQVNIGICLFFLYRIITVELFYTLGPSLQRAFISSFHCPVIRTLLSSKKHICRGIQFTICPTDVRSSPIFGSSASVEGACLVGHCSIL